MPLTMEARKRGGLAASAKLTGEELAERARNAALARWERITPAQRSKKAKAQWNRIKADRLLKRAA